MTRFRHRICWLLLFSFFVATILPVANLTRAGGLPEGVEGPGPESSQAPSKEKAHGLRFRLSEGAESPQPSESNEVVAATRLTDADTEKVLRRLPPIKSAEEDEQSFAWPPKSLPPPRTGVTINAPFPPPLPNSLLDQPASSPLEVSRVSPEGNVPLAPQLSITFNQPMVALTSLSDLSQQDVPVRLEPQPPGRWRWIGTKTLVFDPTDRFPMATEYTATVPAGTHSANGAVLANARTWKFTTPAPQVKNMYPHNSVERRDTLMFVEFDQRVDPATVMRMVQVRAGAGPVKTRLATTAEIAADPNVFRLTKKAVTGRWIAFRAIGVNGATENALSSDAKVTVSIGPGVSSLEGPLTSRIASNYPFETFGALKVTERRCGYDRRCRPSDSWVVVFNNGLDENSLTSSKIRVEPNDPGIRTNIYGSTLQIEGLKKARTVYRVTLPATLRDEFGQTLGKEQTLIFTVGSAPRMLTYNGGNFAVLDPMAPPRFSVYTTNVNTLKVRLYSVTPDDFSAFSTFMSKSDPFADEGAPIKATPPGRLVYNKVLNVKTQPDENVETSIDVGPALRNGLRHVIMMVEPVPRIRDDEGSANGVVAWIQATKIGLDAIVDNDRLVGWATSLKDGSPLSGAVVSLSHSSESATTSSDGLAQLQLPAFANKNARALIARVGDDSAILPETTSWWNEERGWVRKPATDQLEWYVIDDRKMYRPGEEVHIKGWLRRIKAGPDGDIGLLDDSVPNIDWVLNDSRNNEIAKGILSLNALGGFDTSFKLPQGMNLGQASLNLNAANKTLRNNSYRHGFFVEEFRRPEFEVTAKSSEGPFFVGGRATATVNANYFAGGALQNAAVNWNVTAKPGQFTPPNRSDYTFGKWVPWWVKIGEDTEETHSEAYAATTDSGGKHVLQIDFDSVNPPRATNVTAQASVTDVNRQTWTATTTMLVHPADLYVGIRAPRTFVQMGEPLIVEAIVTDIDGKAVPGREVKMHMALLDWVYKNGEWKQEEINPQDCALKSAGDAERCTFKPAEGGTYKVTASIVDDRERRNESEMTLWVAGGKQPPSRNVEQQKVEMIPDRKEYQAGDVAEVLLQAPFYPAEGMLTILRGGIVRTERFRMDSPSHTLKIPILESYVPGVAVQVNLNGSAPRTDESGKVDEKSPPRPAYASGSLDLSVPPLKRKLTVTAIPQDRAIEPGAETNVDVEVKDADGRAVPGGEVAVIVVDEAVLALSNYKLPDPLAIFYSERAGESTDYHSRSDVVLANQGDLTVRLEGAAGGAGGGVAELGRNRGFMMARIAGLPVKGVLADNVTVVTKSGTTEPDEPSAISLRENFNALAVFAPSLKTDANGHTQVKIKLPDNLTRYRVMAVSVSGDKLFGSGESAITARLPLMARPSAPRFLNFGDKFELPIVLQNQTDAAMDVDVAVRSANAELTAGAGRRVTVPANDRVEIRFPAAAVKPGTARFQVAAVSGEWADAAEVSLPVWTPATSEAFATYGEIDSGAVSQPIKPPSDVFEQFGGLEISTSSTQLQELTDAMLYIVSYPFECSEQLSSRIITIAALKDVLAAFKAKGLPPPEDLNSAVARDIKRLQGMQNDDGGFGFWRKGEKTWPYLSVHVANALQRAKEKGFDVPKEMLDKSHKYLREIEKHIPSDYSRESRQAIIAYALNVRLLMADRDASRARRLIAESRLETMSLETMGWLLPVLSGDPKSVAEVALIRRHLNNRATEDAGTAHFVTSYSDGAQVLLHSERRADGIILDALIADQPQSDLIPKIVRGLLAHRSRGRWVNTQENVFILLALDRYFRTFEKTTPDFVARAWLGNRFAGEHEFKGRTTDRFNINVPMRFLNESGAQNLTLGKEGGGRLYYRFGIQYAPNNLNLTPADFGFAVQRNYEAVDNAADVRRDADGTWHIKAGTRVRVRLTMVAPTRRYHVALVDRLPAGFEALNAALAVTEAIPDDPNSNQNDIPLPYRYWMRPWFEHQNLRDERVEAFSSLLWEGVYDYSYVARAITPGAFVVPPAKAEEMYQPETFGRSGTDRVVVE